MSKKTKYWIKQDDRTPAGGTVYRKENRVIVSYNSGTFLRYFSELPQDDAAPATGKYIVERRIGCLSNVTTPHDYYD